MYDEKGNEFHVKYSEKIINEFIKKEQLRECLQILTKSGPCDAKLSGFMYKRVFGLCANSNDKQTLALCREFVFKMVNQYKHRINIRLKNPRFTVMLILENSKLFI